MRCSIVRDFGLVTLLLFFVGIANASELHEAARRGDTDKVKTLAERGVNVNERAANGETPLTLAILGGHISTATLLIDQGADVDMSNKGGFTPAHAAAYAGHRDMVRILAKKGADLSNQSNKAGVSPVSVAAEEGHADVVQLLIELGADFKAGEKNGYTPLTRALWRGQGSTVTVLQQSGAMCQPLEVLEEPFYSKCVAGQRSDAQNN